VAVRTVHDIPLELKGSLVDADGVPYREFRAALRPRWWAIWAQLACGYALLGAIVAGLVAEAFGLRAAFALGAAVVIVSVAGRLVVTEERIRDAEAAADGQRPGAGETIGEAAAPGA
jgi:MFS family permease